jgi:hypothetical protein
MISLRNLRLAFSLTCICSCLALAAEDPNLKPPVLQFEESPDDLDWVPGVVKMLAENARQKITYAVGIVRKPGTAFFLGVTGTPGFGDRVLTLDLSEGQKQLLQMRRVDSNTFARVVDQSLGRDVDHGGRTQLILYAVSLEDAKKMAQAYIDCATQVYAAHRRLSQEGRQETLWKISAKKRRIAEIAQVLGTSPDDFDSFMRTVPYRSEKEAVDAMAELDKTLNATTVEIAGIQAKLKAIQGDQSSPSTPVAIRPDLELMFVQESIALQAAEARKRSATDLRSQAKRFIDLTQGPAERLKLMDEVVNHEEGLRAIEKELATEKPPEIVDNKVFIYRVRQSE